MNKKAIERVKNTIKRYKKYFQRNSYKKKSLFIKDGSDSLETYESDVSSNIRLFMAVGNQNDEFIEEEGEFDLEAELVSALTKLRKVRRECKHFKEEIENIENELQKSNKFIESTEIMIIDLKLKIEEARLTEPFACRK